uniref:Reverse transcriptase domain-containing protein n=1 Tax=Arion vulgaris TaxID=1028688 RepID=A0A0B7BTT6_9EUPU
MESVEEALQGIKLKKSPGKDGITNEMLINLGKKAKKELLIVLSASWEVVEIPREWKEAITVPNLKQGKDRFDPSNCIPISLCMCVGKVMERLLNRRRGDWSKNN